MTLDRDLRTALAEQADRREAPPPDVDALRAGGLARRRRHRQVVGAVAAVAILGTLAAGLAVGEGLQDTRGVDPVDRPSPRVVEPTQNVGELSFLDLATGKRTPADGFSTDAEYWFSPDGSKVACSGSCFGKTGSLYVADSDGGDLVELHVPFAVNNSGRPLDGSEPYQLTWSPDGTHLLYTVVHWSEYSNIQDVFLHDIASDETSTVIDFGLQDRSYFGLAGLDFSLDGSTVIYAMPRRPFACPEPEPVAPCAEHEDFDLWSVAVTGGEPSRVLRNATLPAYLADGRSIAFARPLYGAYGGSSIEIATNGDRRTLAPAEDFLDFIGELLPSPDRSTLLGVTGRRGVYVVDAATGDVSHLYANTADWAGDDRLLIGCIPVAQAPSEEPRVDSCSTGR
jgi:hypothetical protein